MKRVLVVDDERPVVEHIVHLITRDLAGEFEVVGTASSGREALEKSSALSPDIIVLDVLMPGLSGLDTIREFHRRGVHSSFILSTAYERFDIAREALELGVVGYLLKPVARDKLSSALRRSAELQGLRADQEQREVGWREKDLQLHRFAAATWLSALMLGDPCEADGRVLREVLGVTEAWGLIGAAAFPHAPMATYETLRSTLLYKTKALCGPLVSGRCVLFVGLSEATQGPNQAASVFAALQSTLGEDLQRGHLKLAFGDARPVGDLVPSWYAALGRLTPREASWGRTGLFAAGSTFEDEEAFTSALIDGAPDRARLSLEAILVSLEPLPVVPAADRYRVISLLGSTMALLVRRGHLDEATAHHWMDFDDLHSTTEGRAFALCVRSRLPVISGAVSEARRWSPWVAEALEFIRAHYGKVLTLELAADHVGISPKRLSRLFIEELGQGFSDYVIDFRIEKAKVLLALPGNSIKQVSIECGYPDPNYFSRLFKKVTGLTPTLFAEVAAGAARD